MSEGHRKLIQSYRSGYRASHVPELSLSASITPTAPVPAPARRPDPEKISASTVQQQQAAAAMAAMVFAGSSYLPLLNVAPADPTASTTSSGGNGSPTSMVPPLPSQPGMTANVTAPVAVPSATAGGVQLQLSKSAMRRTQRGMRSTIAVGAATTNPFASTGQLPNVVPPSRSPLSMTTTGSFSIAALQQQQQTLSIIDEAEAAELFAAATDASLIDHPLCAECASSALAAASEALRKTRTEIRGYQMADEDALRLLQSSNIEQLDKDTAELAIAEQQLVARLEEIAQAKALVKRETELCTKRLAMLNELELRYWERYNSHHRRALEFAEDAYGTRVALACGRRRLASLCRSNVLNDAFHIWHSGHFATINGLRLGRLASVPVDWIENNAAWGHASLLLSTLCKIVRFESPTYMIVPMGNGSRLIKKDGGTLLELAGDSGRLFSGRRFDSAMAAFLVVVRELAEYCHKVDSTLALPYAVDRGDRIGGLSVRTQFNDDHVWTRALKFLLTDLKWLIAWVSTRTRR